MGFLTAGFEVFDSPEAMMASEDTQPQPQEQPQRDSPTGVSACRRTANGVTVCRPRPAPLETQAQQDSNQIQPEYSQEDIEEAVLRYASERLGTQIESFDQLQSPQQQAIDERVAKIAEFVETTGRGPEDWFRYQSLNPETMDDLTAVRVNLASEYPNLSSSEINLLIRNSYKLDPNKHDAEAVQLSSCNSRSMLRERDRTSPICVRDTWLLLRKDWTSNPSLMSSGCSQCPSRWTVLLDWNLISVTTRTSPLDLLTSTAAVLRMGTQTSKTSSTLPE